MALPGLSLPAARSSIKCSPHDREARSSKLPHHQCSLRCRSVELESSITIKFLADVSFFSFVTLPATERREISVNATLSCRGRLCRVSRVRSPASSPTAVGRQGQHIMFVRGGARTVCK